MTALLSLFKSKEQLRAERIAAWKAEEARLKRALENAMKEFGICSRQANSICAQMDRMESEAYAA